MNNDAPVAQVILSIGAFLAVSFVSRQEHSILQVYCRAGDRSVRGVMCFSSQLLNLASRLTRSAIFVIRC